LRIGVSVAKGIAYGASIPLIGIETPLSMFFGFNDEMRMRCNADESTIFCPMLDARRMEVYYALFDKEGKKTGEITAAVIDEKSFTDIPEEVRIIFFGDGSAKCRGVIGRRNTCFSDEFRISAASMVRPVYAAIGETRFEDTAYFEPFYLKDFITTSPVKNIPGRRFASGL
jgi:tRNA threonylcarbamoyladenosine biosynthesis protein TsaB